MQTLKTNLEGSYKVNSDQLISDSLTLKIGQRHRPKKGQAKRFIGLLDPTKPDSEQFSYISSLYATQGTKNTYDLECEKQRYSLTMTGLNTVVISRKEYEAPLVFKD